MRASDLHVIAVISNPVRYRSRVRLMQEFQARMAAAGVTLWVVEATFGERPAAALDSANPRHIQVRCDSELWLKENLVNVGARHLPADARYVMWCDADVSFQRADWATETIEALQHYPVVQPFSHVIDYGPHGEVLELQKSFGFCYRQGDKLGAQNRLGGWKYGGPFWHPGYAFAWRMDAWNAVGGMIDRAIMGAGDYHMACALIGRAEVSLPPGLHANYVDMVHAWADRADAVVRGELGYLPGTLHHFFHGWKGDRNYQPRWRILTDNDYDPSRDVTYDRAGVLQWSTSKRQLIREAHDYFRVRNEDAGELYA